MSVSLFVDHAEKHLSTMDMECLENMEGGHILIRGDAHGDRALLISEFVNPSARKSRLIVHHSFFHVSSRADMLRFMKKTF